MADTSAPDEIAARTTEDTTEDDAVEPLAKKAKRPAGPGSKRIAGKQTRLDQVRAQIEKNKKRIAELGQISSFKTLTAKQRTSLEVAHAKITELETKVLPEAEADLEQVKLAVKAERAKAEAALLAKMTKMEGVRHMSDSGAIFLVELVLL